MTQDHSGPTQVGPSTGGARTAAAERLPSALDPRRRVQLLCAVTGSVLCVIYALSLALPPSSTVSLLRLPVYIGVYLAVLLACIAEMRMTQGDDRRTAQYAVSGMIIAILGTAYYELVLRPLATRPYPALSDYGRFVIDALFYAAALIQLKGRVRTWHPSVWMDFGIVTTTATAFGVQFWMTPLLHLNEGNVAATVVSFLYILGDLLLLSAMLGGWAMLGRCVDKQWVLFSLALGILTIGDGVLFTQQALRATSAFRPLLDLGMMCAALLFAWAVSLHESHRRSRRAQTSTGYGVLIAPSLSALLALGLTTPIRGWQPSILTQMIAAVALVIVGARSFLTYAELRSLADARAEVRTDQLTGLANRRGFTEAVEEHLSNTEGAEGSLMLLDIRKFKEINDSLGHFAGDKLLTAVAERLMAQVPQAISVARLGGNEFAVFLTGTDAGQTCAAVVRDLSDHPFEVDTIRLHLTLGASIAHAPEHGTTFSALIRAADLALTQSKDSRSIVTFEESMAEGFGESRVVQAGELREALETDQIVVYYQPKVRLSDEMPFGVEALVRWVHPEKGLIFPDNFLPLAEQSGLMPRLNEVVMQQAITEVATWHRAGLPMSLSINLPAAAIMDSKLPARVQELLDEVGLPSSALTVEITEETLLGDRVRAKDVLAELRRTGVSVSIDDYGTGYSSLAYLRELPVDELKLDKSFVFPMSSDPRAAAIVRSTIDLAHSLGLAIVAEGVEDQTTAEQLADYDCDVAQGYHFSRPVPAGVLLKWFETQDMFSLPTQRG